MELRVLFSSPNRLKNAFTFKDPIMKELNSLVLYEYTCGICNNSYVGKTKCHFMVRQQEHLGVSILTGNNLTYNDQSASAVRKHCHQNNHESMVNDFKIIGSARNNFHLLLKESIIISVFKPTLNNTKESMPLYLF